MKKFKQYIYLGALIGSVAVAGADDSGNRAARADGQGGTGFRLHVNDIRQFNLDQNTVISVDGVVNPNLKLAEIGGTGYKVRYRVGSDVNGTITDGTLEGIDLINTHKGPITSVEPLRVFDIDVLVTANTFGGDPATVDNLTVGQAVEISGFVDTNSSVLATRIEPVDQPLSEWKLSGYVSNSSATQFSIADQVVALDSITPDNCDAGLADGDYVEVKANPAPAFTSGDTLNGVISVECVEEEVIGSPNNAIPVAIEGIVDSVEANGDFTIADQLVSVNVGFMPVYINGEAEDVMVGAKLEVEGFLDPFGEIVLAHSIKFLEVRFKFEESVQPEDVFVGRSIQLYGQMIMATPQTRDDDMIISNGLTAATQVEVRGYVDKAGQLFATRVRERGAPDLSDVTLDGQITALDNPNLSVMGIAVDTSSSTLQNYFGEALTAAAFFEQVEVGTLLEIDGAVHDEGAGTVSGGVIRINEPVVEPNPSQPPVLSFGLGVGTITSQADALFSEGFE